MQQAMRCVFYVFHEMSVRVSVDDRKLFLKEISMDMRVRTRKLYELRHVEMEKVHMELSVIKVDEEGNSKLEVSNPCLRQRLK